MIEKFSDLRMKLKRFENYFSQRMQMILGKDPTFWQILFDGFWGIRNSNEGVSDANLEKK